MAAAAAAALVPRKKRPAPEDSEDCAAKAGEKRCRYDTIKEANLHSTDHEFETVEEYYEFDSIDDYEMLEDLDGSSTSCCGGVARARDRCTGETVGIKRVRRPSSSEDDDDGGAASLLCAVVREAGCLAACRGHPSVLQLKSLATDETTGDMFIVTEPLVGGTGTTWATLRSHLITRQRRRGERRGFSEAETRAFMRQLLGAAEAMHGAGVTHRDMNPDNILVGPDGALKICGFGCATTATTVTTTKPGVATHVVVGEPEPPMGTLLYRSPEQLYCCFPQYGPEEDMWALGCVMAELLAGAPLFNADTEEGLLEQTIDLRDDIVSVGVEAFDGMLDHLSVAGRELLVGLLEFDSWERLAAADALKHRWFAEDDVGQSRVKP